MRCSKMFNETTPTMIKTIDTIVIRFICSLKIIIETTVVKTKPSPLKLHKLYLVVGVALFYLKIETNSK